MILKTLLKYKIFEWCLDALVGKLITNFRTNPNGLIRVPLKELRPGMVLAEIWIIIDSRGYKGIWKNCAIDEITYWYSGINNSRNIREICFTWGSHWDNKTNNIEYPSGVMTGGNDYLCSIQSYEQDSNGFGERGITPEFYI